MMKIWPKVASYARFSAASAARVSRALCATPDCSFMDDAPAFVDCVRAALVAPIRGWRRKACSHSLLLSAFQISSAARRSSSRSEKGRLANMRRTHSLDPQQSSNAAEAFFSGRELNHSTPSPRDFGAGAPQARNRLTPPSGKILKRRCETDSVHTIFVRHVRG